MNKVILGFFVSLFAIVLALNAVAGTYGQGDFVDRDSIEVAIDGIDLDEGYNPSLDVSQKVSVDVQFIAERDASDVKVEVSLKGIGLKNDIEAITSRFHVVEGKTYHKGLELTLPSTDDLDELTEDVTLVVEITADDEDAVVETYEFGLQRQEYNLNVLSVERPDKVNAGSTFQVEVVVENNGNERLENVYVKVSIADLGVQKKMYVGDLEPRDEIEEADACDIEDFEDEDELEECILDLFRNEDLDEDDTAVRTVYLSLPSSAASGSYNLEVEAYNVDAKVTKQEKITVEAVKTGAYPLGSKTVAPGKEAILEFNLFNQGESAMVYTIAPETASGLIVEVLTPTVVVPGESTQTVSVKVKATSSAVEGTHTVTLNINGESGSLVNKVPLTVNVEKASGVTSGFTGSNNYALILTVVLVIVFVVLLIILIVLLTKKPAESEEFGETSYY